MVKDNHNKVYTELMTYLKGIYPEIKGGTEFRDGPTVFPYVYFFQIDSQTALQTLSQTEDGVDVSYQIEVYTNNGSNNARKISNNIRTFMIENGFICRRFKPIERETKVSRFVAIYNRLDV